MFVLLAKPAVARAVRGAVDGGDGCVRVGYVVIFWGPSLLVLVMLL